SRPHRHDRVLGRRHAHPDHRAARRGRQAGLHRQHLRADLGGQRRAGRRAADVRRPGRRRRPVQQPGLRHRRELAEGGASGRVPLLRAGWPRLRHVPEGNHQHRLVRCLGELAADARLPVARQVGPWPCFPTRRRRLPAAFAFPPPQERLQPRPTSPGGPPPLRGGRCPPFQVPRRRTHRRYHPPTAFALLPSRPCTPPPTAAGGSTCSNAATAPGTPASATTCPRACRRMPTARVRATPAGAVRCGCWPAARIRIAPALRARSGGSSSCRAGASWPSSPLVYSAAPTPRRRAMPSPAVPRATIALAAGGTGGHLFPAEALARELLARGHDVVIHTERRGAQYTRALDGLAHVVLPASSLEGGIAAKLRAVLAILRG